MPPSKQVSDRLGRMTTGSILAEIPDFEKAKERALFQAETEVRADLAQLKRMSSSAFNETDEGEIERAIIDRALELLKAEQKQLNTNQTNVKQTDSDAGAGNTIDNLLESNKNKKE
jgi:ABC-type transporter Mla MlaB component